MDKDNGSLHCTQTMYLGRTNNGTCNHVIGFWIREEAFIGRVESSAILMGWWMVNGMGWWMLDIKKIYRVADPTNATPPQLKSAKSGYITVTLNYFELKIS